MIARIAHTSRLWLSSRLRFSSSKEVSMMMNEKIAVMKETLMKTTPRAFSVLFMLASVPAFYFINEMLEREYSDPEFVNSSNRFYKYYYLYNLTFFACGIALSRFNFHNPSSKFTIPKTKVKSAVIPFLLSVGGLIIPETDNKHLVWPAVLTQFSSLVVEGVMVNKGILPFWFYSYRHYIGLCYFIMFIINFTAIKRLEQRRTTHPHEFVEMQMQPL
jgi:hypothetical protein